MGWNPGSHVSSGWVGVIYSQEETLRAPKSLIPTECPLESKTTGSGWKEGKDQVWRGWSCLSYSFLQGIKHMHQGLIIINQLIIIRSIPFIDTDLDLVWWFWFNDPQLAKKTPNIGSFWKYSFCAVSPSLHSFPCRGSQPDLLGAIQRFI